MVDALICNAANVDMIFVGTVEVVIIKIIGEYYVFL